MGLAALAGHRATRAIRRHSCTGMITLIENHPIPHGRARDDAHDTILFTLPEALIIGEEEKTVFENRAAERTAEDIAEQFERFVGKTIADFRLLDKVIARSGNRVAMRFKERAMEGVCTALGDQRNLRAGGPSLVGVVISSGDAELLHGILRNGQY